MAKNSIQSVVKAINPNQFFKIEGRIVEATPFSFKIEYRESGKRRITESVVKRSDVAMAGADYIYLRRPGRALAKGITGVANIDKLTGWVEVDGVLYNPDFAEVTADLGVPEEAATTKKAGAKKKKAK